ncbi:MAG: Na+/H+ antiporter NhaC family protein [Lachnospiraceae bacterium]|jgi:Na+/H+ antiporter NhaC
MGEKEESSGKEFAAVYGGAVGGSLPLIVMLAAMIILALAGYRSTMNYWVAGYAAIIVGFFVYKDKGRFQKAVIDGVRSNIFSFMLIIFLLAGVLSKIFTASHLVEALVWLFSLAHITPAMLPAICFLLPVILSTATGSAAAATTTAAPILLPLAQAMGVDINIACGAILAGGAFGDNLAPISDTTIASSLTQEAKVIYVVKSRLKYSLIAGAAALVGYIIAGITHSGTPAAAAEVDSQYASSLVFLILPVLIIVMMLKGANLLTALIVNEIIGIIMLLVFGYTDIATLVAKDGLIASGFNGMLSSAIFILFIFIMVSLITEAGVLDALLKSLKRYAKSERTAEIVSGLMVSLLSIMISSGTTAIAATGPMIRQILKPFHIDRNRAANLLDGLGCGVGYLVPTNAGCLNLAALAVSAGVVADGYNPLSFVGWNFHSIALTVVFWAAILTGWGRKHETKESLAAQGIVDDEIS